MGFVLHLPSSLSHAPHIIHDENGKVTGVILAYSDYQTFLRVLAAHTDWETLHICKMPLTTCWPTKHWPRRVNPVLCESSWSRRERCRADDLQRPPPSRRRAGATEASP